MSEDYTALAHRLRAMGTEDRSEVADALDDAADAVESLQAERDEWLASRGRVKADLADACAERDRLLGIIERARTAPSQPVPGHPQSVYDILSEADTAPREDDNADYREVFGRDPEPWREPLGALRLTLAGDGLEWQLERARDECEWLVRVLNGVPEGGSHE